ncbi:MAG TPA: NifB/NifX family molybdenum-iron cluster-binding protein [Candidatus Hydrogenedentes bacterium]|nr:NifB/NifX family molybdenum-iron cluster-binding protein [Candidatus Hydrogenedentota bacterium]
MKIAVASGNGKELSEHFGRSACFVVFTITDGTVSEEEVRANVGARHHGDATGAESHHGQGACHGHAGVPGHGEEHLQHSHAGLLALLGDCDAVICGGMGPRAAHDLEQHGIRPIITDQRLSVRDAVTAFLEGNLKTSRATCSHHRH